MRACYLVERIGPYHAARLDHAGKFGEITVVELNADATTYAWGKVASTHLRFQRRAMNGRSVPLETVLTEIDPEVVFLNGWSDRSALMAWRWAQRRGMPVVMMSDSQRHDERRVFWKEWFKRGVLAGCQAAFVAGRRHADYLAALGFGSKPVTLGYDVVDNAHFSKGAATARAEADAVRARWQLPERYFLCVSRFVAKKNLPLLLRAFAAYRRDAGPDAWHLVLLGDGEQREELETQIARDGLAEMVHLRGFLQHDELPTYYGLASALVLASTTDQWGLAVNEAMAAGLPVLVSRVCGCVPELIKEGVNGWTFDPHDEPALVQWLTHLTSTACDRPAMGQASQEIIAGWSLNRYADGFWEAARAAQRGTATPSRWEFKPLIIRIALRFLFGRV